MEYITGIQALNIPCSLETSGDWHSVNMDWKNLNVQDSSGSVFGDWGIEGLKSVPNNTKKFYVADTIRACLDLLEKGNFSIVQGMRNDYICNDKYNDIVMEKVSLLKGSPFWDKIDEFMVKEYYMKWVNYRNERRL